MADAFENDIGAVAAREFADARDASFGRGGLGEIDDFVSAELLGHFETMRGPADDDHAGSAGGFGDGERGDADGTGALDHDGVLPIDAGAFDAVNGGDERATGADDAFGGKIVGDFENIGAGAEVMKFSVAAEEVRRLIAAIADAVSATLGAAGGLMFFGAVITFAAGRGGGPGHAIANGEWLARPVVREAGAELLDHADGFVAEDDGELDGEFAFPEMNVGAADAGHLGADKSGSWFEGWWERVFAQRER